MTLLELRGISKRFLGVQALDRVDFDLYPGEVHALVGENGAGKSTLMKILSGVVPKDAGVIRLDGREVQITDPQVARQLGIGMVYQELSLIPTLTVAENIFLGGPEWSRGWIDWGQLYRQAGEVLAKLDCAISPRSRVSRLSVAEQQLVEIAKAVSRRVRVLLLDEPTSALSAREAERLFATIRRLKEEGVGIIYVSHRLPEVMALSDRITVLRDGRRIATVRTSEVSEYEVVRMMVGRSLYPARREAETVAQQVLLEVEDVATPTGLKGISFQLRAGEILAVFGAMGAGRTELARALFGLDQISSGRVVVCGRVLARHTPREAVRAGLGYLPEDRRQGLVLLLSITANITLASLGEVARWGVLRAQAEEALAAGVARDLRLALARLGERVAHLSGGNQQKVALARWLISGARVLILDEPTRGIDISAKAEVYAILANLARHGVGILLLSSEVPEVLAVSHRILVMRRGRIVAEFSPAEASADALVGAAVGGEVGE